MSSITRFNETCSSQDLALEARDIWLEWNRSIKESCVSDLPHPLTPEDELLTLCGVYHLADGSNMIERYVENLRVMEDTAPTFRELQFIKVRARAISGISFVNSKDRTTTMILSGSRSWAQNGPKSTTSLTTSRTVLQTGSSMRAQESHLLTR